MPHAAVRANGLADAPLPASSDLYPTVLSMTRATLPQQHAPGTRLRRFTALAMLGAAACGSSESKNAAVADSTGGAASAAAPAAGTAGAAATPAGPDTAMAGMAHSQMAGMNRSAPKDSNQAFLRMMSDHHQGLIVMADSAQGRLQAADAKAKAREMEQKQTREQQQILTMLRRQYQDSITPMVMPSNRAMLDSVVRAAPAGEVDRVFYRQVIAHHREAIQMVDQMQSHLKGEVRSMAQRMRADQQREIQELERKAAKSS